MDTASDSQVFKIMLYTARKTGLLVRDVGDETIVYDREGDTFKRLNASAATAFRRCQEGASLGDIAQALADELDLPLDEELAQLAVSELMDAGLITGDTDEVPLPTRLSRRTVVKRVSAGAVVAVMVPVVESMVAPQPAYAQSY
jgi:hypothetical protein